MEILLIIICLLTIKILSLVQLLNDMKDITNAINHEDLFYEF